MPHLHVFRALGVLIATASWAGAAEDCLDYPYTDPDGPAALRADIETVALALEPFDTLRQTFETARPRICLTDAPSEALGTYGADDRSISVNANIPPDKRVAVLLHEIRHLEQDYRGICPSETLAIRSNARAIFALEADAMAITHLIAWALREKGTPGPFQALSTSDETADIAAAFRQEMQATGDPSLATAAAFSAWYASDIRREQYYVSSCMAYLDRIEADKLLPGRDVLKPDFLGSVCNLPEGSAYPCTEPKHPLPR